MSCLNQHLYLLLLYKEVVREDRQERCVHTERLSKEEKKETGRGKDKNKDDNFDQFCSLCVCFFPQR